MDALETKLDELFVKKMSLKLPEAGKKFLVDALPWLALIGAVLSILGGLGVLTFLMTYGQMVNQTAALYGYTGGSSVILMSWLSLLAMAAQAIISIMAFGPLRRHEKRGWNLIYWLDLFSIAMAVVTVFISGNVMGLVMSLLGAAVGLYLLFQIRSAYTTGQKAATK